MADGTEEPGPIRAVVCDDEPAAREAIRTLLPPGAGVEIVGEAASGSEALARLRALRPDLVFLDVQMPDLTGFEVLQALGRETPRAVVFVTAHDEHALRAFEVHALDYLLKPFGRARLAAAVERARRHLRAGRALELHRTVLEAAAGREADRREAGEAVAPDDGAGARRGGGGRPTRIAVRTGRRIVLVPVADIDWVEADGDYVRIHAGDGEHLVTGRLHAMEELLGPNDFHRIHRSIVVRLERIRELQPDGDGGGAALLEDGVRLRVSRSRWESLTRALGLAGA